MIGRDKSFEVMEHVLKQTGADQAEVRLQGENFNMSRFARNTIHQNLTKNNATLTLKVVFGKKIGTATVNRLDSEGIKQLVETAEMLAKLQEDNRDFVSLPEPTDHQDMTNYYAATATCTPEERAKTIEAVINAADKVDYLAYGSFFTETSELAVLSSLGTRAYNQSTSSYLRTVIGNDRDPGTGYADSLSRNVADIDAAAVGEEAVKRALLSQGGRDITTGEYEVVFTPYAVSDLIRFLGYLGFNGGAVQDGRSFMSSKMGQQITGSNISIWDDAYNPHTLNMPFDMEGVAKQKISLIEDGIARGAVYDSFAAHKDGNKSTGHAMPRYVGGLPANMVMAAGSSSLDEMIKNTKKGIYITRFHYTHCPEPMEVIMTGTTRDGTYYIENGEIKHPIKNLRMTDSVLRVLSHASLISADRKLQRDWWSTFNSLLPAIKVEKCKFTGATTF